MITRLRVLLEKCAKAIRKGAKIDVTYTQSLTSILPETMQKPDRQLSILLAELEKSCNWTLFQMYSEALHKVGESDSPDEMHHKACIHFVNNCAELRSSEHQTFVANMVNFEKRYYSQFMEKRTTELALGYPEEYEARLLYGFREAECNDIQNKASSLLQKLIPQNLWNRNCKSINVIIDDPLQVLASYDHTLHAIVHSTLSHFVVNKLVTKVLILHLGSVITGLISNAHDDEVINNYGLTQCYYHAMYSVPRSNRSNPVKAWIYALRYSLTRDSMNAKRLLKCLANMPSEEAEIAIELLRHHCDLVYNEHGNDDENCVFNSLLPSGKEFLKYAITGVARRGAWTFPIMKVFRKLICDHTVYVNELDAISLPSRLWLIMACQVRQESDQRNSNTPLNYFLLMDKTRESSIYESDPDTFLCSASALIMGLTERIHEGYISVGFREIMIDAMKFIKRNQNVDSIFGFLLNAIELLSSSDDEDVKLCCSEVRAFMGSKIIMERVEHSKRSSKNIMTSMKMRLNSAKESVTEAIPSTLFRKLHPRTIDLLIRAEMNFYDESQLQGEHPVYNSCISYYTDCILNELLVKYWDPIRRKLNLQTVTIRNMRNPVWGEMVRAIEEISLQKRFNGMDKRYVTITNGLNSERQALEEIREMRNKAAHNEKIDREKMNLFHSMLFRRGKLRMILELVNI